MIIFSLFCIISEKIFLILENFIFETIYICLILVIPRDFFLEIFEIEDNKEKICSRFSDTDCHRSNITRYGLHIDHPPAWELTVL